MKSSLTTEGIQFDLNTLLYRYNKEMMWKGIIKFVSVCVMAYIYYAKSIYLISFNELIHTILMYVVRLHITKIVQAYYIINNKDNKHILPSSSPVYCSWIYYFVSRRKKKSLMRNEYIFRKNLMIDLHESRQHNKKSHQSSNRCYTEIIKKQFN